MVRRSRLVPRRACRLLGGVFVVALVAGCGAAGPPPPRRAGVGCEQLQASTTCSVLFIGNSYTDVNDLPGTFARLAGAGGHPVAIGVLTAGGAVLAEHAASPDTARMLHAEIWNVVVLQDQSQAPSVAEHRLGEMYPAARTLVDEVRAVKAQPLLFLTWAHRQGWRTSRRARSCGARTAAIPRWAGPTSPPASSTPRSFTAAPSA